MAVTEQRKDSSSSVQSINGRRSAAWVRCREELGLETDMRPSQTSLSTEQLKRLQDQFGEMFEVARAEMNSLARRLAGTRCGVAIADARGTVLHYLGDPEFNALAARVGLRPGTDWGEKTQGNNAIGSCAAMQRSVCVSGDEHYLTANRWMSGTGIPVFSGDGQLAFVLALLTATNEHDNRQPYVTALLEMAAQLIDRRAFLKRFANRMILRFHSRPDSVDTIDGGLIAIGREQRVLGMSQTARSLLGDGAPDSSRYGELGELLNLQLDELPEGNEEPGIVFDSRQGRRFYVLLTPPADHPQESPASTQTTEKPGDDAVNAEDYLASLELGDPAVAGHIRRAKRLAGENIPILIHGETGTGKEVFAKSLHRAGSRRDGPFVAVNCASIPETLIESELFGYKGGAFTGASRRGNTGRIVQADGGTLFLDEIGDMPLALQARLLRVLQEREVLPLGGDKAVPVDLCLISATHRDLRELIAEGQFREDLYYRLQGFTLTLPPLRERHDRTALIEHLLACSSAPAQPPRIDPEAMRLLDGYHWPGNIRQLVTCIRTMVALQEGGCIRVDDLPAEIRLGEIPQTASRHYDDGLERHQAGEETGSALRQAERDTLVTTLRQHHWHVNEAAETLAISRSTLYRKMKRYGIYPPRQKSPFG
ncbi:sigma-54-dependent Fis family transcriptional regulator [Methylonatrum kenyense]|uniref:sigma-54-dependent Fis family transcriptional regulator n=1 Tax=Methylonatrum kenyense TaxID=455253 RepID=UPI0020C07D19|nr:sigma-54-dependent Fis family transcriptional regulator [Methylonatrum kenyense]MCK8515151.1 sigma-54-dependent Fis family transcriptional regulator [Methylonatrum kenyense]